MNEKSKAEDLVNQCKIILMDEDTDCGHELLCTHISVKLAKVSVNEILNNLKTQFVVGYAYQIEKDYWDGVIIELDKI